MQNSFAKKYPIYRTHIIQIHSGDIINLFSHFILLHINFLFLHLIPWRIKRNQFIIEFNIYISDTTLFLYRMSDNIKCSGKFTAKTFCFFFSNSIIYISKDTHVLYFNICLCIFCNHIFYYFWVVSSNISKINNLTKIFSAMAFNILNKPEP